VRVKSKNKPKRDADYIGRAKKSDADAIKLKNKTHDWNRDKIEEYLRKNPPSPETIAALLHGLYAENRRESKRKSDELRRLKTEAFYEEIRAAYRNMTNTEPHNRASRLAIRFDRCPSTIRKIIGNRKTRVQ